MQINVDRRRTAQEILAVTANQEKVDLILVSEPNLSILKKKSWYVDEDKRVCIINSSRGVQISKWGKGKGFVWVATEDIYIYATYISPNVTVESYANWLVELQADLRGKG